MLPTNTLGCPLRRATPIFFRRFSGSERGKRFLISYPSEEQLEKKYRRDALWLGLVALGLFLFGTIFVGVGVADALGVFGA